MKLSILQENLARGLSTTSRSVATRAQLPVLSNILLATDQGRLKLSATNLETGINFWLGAKIEKEGALSVPAKILTEFVSSLPAGKIEMETKEGSLRLVSGSYEASFVGMAPSEFPAIPSLKKKADLQFSGQLLTSAINEVAFAAAQDEGRPVLAGVLLQIQDSQLVLVATDGYRLSLKKIKEISGLDKVKELKKGLVLPARTLLEVARMTVEKEANLGLSVTPEASQLIFATSESEIVSRLIEGNFPDFEKIIPGKGKTKVILDREDLTRAVRMAAIFARESANIIRFQVSGSSLQVSANTAQVGDNKSLLDAKIEGEKGEIAFNSRYLLDFLNIVGSEEITFEMSGTLNPGIFRPVGEPSYLHIIMPVRVQK
jgi:DNA polymerase-3 subunit beta